MCSIRDKCKVSSFGKIAEVLFTWIKENDHELGDSRFIYLPRTTGGELLFLILPFEPVQIEQGCRIF